jgi:TRAP-type C4-dicarboxylate transport system permease small subunit
MIGLLYTLGVVINRLIRLVIVILFTMMVVLVFAQVVARALGNSLTWSEELSRFTMIWMVFLASSIAYKEKSHIIVDNLVKALPAKWSRRMQLVSLIFQIIFLAVLLWGAYLVIPTTSMQRSPANSINMANIYIAIPISAVLILIDVIISIFCSVVGKGGDCSK